MLTGDITTDCLALAEAYEEGENLIRLAAMREVYGEPAVVQRIEELKREGFVEDRLRAFLTEKGRLAGVGRLVRTEERRRRGRVWVYRKPVSRRRGFYCRCSGAGCDRCRP